MWYAELQAQRLQNFKIDTRRLRRASGAGSGPRGRSLRFFPGAEFLYSLYMLALYGRLPVDVVAGARAVTHI